MEFEILSIDELRKFDDNKLVEYRNKLAGELEKAESKFSIEELSRASQELVDEFSRRETQRNLRSAQFAAANSTQDMIVTSKPVIEERQDASSEAYHRAWLKTIAKRGGLELGELSDVEQRAFTFTTTNTPNAVPTILQNKIWDLVESSTVFFGDISKTNFKNVFQILRHVSINEGDAAQVTEGSAPTDEKDTFSAIELNGVEILKTVTLSRKMAVQSVEGFEKWLVNHIGHRIANALDALSLERMVHADFGMDSANKISVAEAGKLTAADVRKMLGLLKADADGMASTKGRVIYANTDTIWNDIAGVTDENGRALFIQSELDSDPATQGRIYGVPVKCDDNIADNALIAGYPSAVEGNIFDGISITADVENKTQLRNYTGYVLYDCGLAVPKAFAKLTVTTGA